MLIKDGNVFRSPGSTATTTVAWSWWGNTFRRIACRRSTTFSLKHALRCDDECVMNECVLRVIGEGGLS